MPHKVTQRSSAFSSQQSVRLSQQQQSFFFFVKTNPKDAYGDVKCIYDIPVAVDVDMFFFCFITMSEKYTLDASVYLPGIRSARAHFVGVANEK